MPWKTVALLAYQGRLNTGKAQVPGKEEGRGF